MNKQGASRISALIMLVLSVVLMLLIPFQVERTEAALTEPVIGSRVYPLLIVSVMLGLSLFRLWKVFRNPKPMESGTDTLSNPRWLVGALVLILYVCLMPWLGFTLASFLTMLAAMRILGERIRLMGVTYCAVAVGVVWFVFGKFLEIPLPAGVF
ncbi:MAG: tripartite tricarboxylate transporter TctB family protein [Oceanipulchritudo sp.]